MNTGKWEEIRDKLGFKRAAKPLLIGMAAILVLVAVASGRVLSGAATASDFELSSSQRSEEAPSAEPTIPTIFVHVSGSVNTPGLYEVEAGSRVADAVKAAGGFAEDAAPDSCNLARILDDGEHIIVSSTDQATAPDEAPAQSPQPSAAPLNINTASAEQLESLPGIGKATASKIVADRTANGQFKSVGDLTRVPGIGDKKLAALDGLICV